MTLSILLFTLLFIAGCYLLFRWQYQYQITDAYLEIRLYRIPINRFKLEDIEQVTIHRKGPIASLCGGFVGDWDITAHNYANRLLSQSYVEIRMRNPVFQKVTLTPESPDEFVSRIMAARQHLGKHESSTNQTA